MAFRPCLLANLSPIIGLVGLFTGTWPIRAQDSDRALLQPAPHASTVADIGAVPNHDITYPQRRRFAQPEADETLKAILRNLLLPMREYWETHKRYPTQLSELPGYRQSEGTVIRLYVDSAFWSATAISSRVPGITCSIRFGIDDDVMAGIAWCEPTVVRAAAALVRIDLRNLIVAMETYWAEHHHYPEALAPMSRYYKPGPGITIVLSNVSDLGWTATGTTSKMSGLVCRLVLPPPANSRTGDEPQCSVARP